MILEEIQATIQQVIGAISAVFQLAVEIADHKWFHIAGTGAVKSEISQNMSNKDSVYRECLRTGKPVIAENLGHHTLCAPYAHYQNCMDYGEVCASILLNQRVLGVIDLFSFTEEQHGRLFYNVDVKIVFLNKRGGLIAAKIKEDELMEEILSYPIHSSFRLPEQLSTRDSDGKFGKLTIVKTKYKVVHLFAAYHIFM